MTGTKSPRAVCALVAEIRIKGADGVRRAAESVRLEKGGSPRQISLADGAALNWARLRGGRCTGRYKADLITAGLDYKALPPGSRLAVGTAELEISAEKKFCFEECPLLREDESCALYESCAFARVVSPGAVRAGNEIIQR